MKSRLRQWLERSGTKSKYGEGFDHVTCKLCNRAFKAISYLHLVRKHHFDPARPQEEYKRKYGLILVESVGTIRKRHRSQDRAFERQGRRWTRARVKSEIRALAAGGRPLNHESIKKSRGNLDFAARTLFGSWNRALAACGIDGRKVRLRREWTRESVVAAISAEARSGRPMNYTAIKVRNVGLAMAAVLRFGSWDSALRAARIDPVDVRMRRAWTRTQVLEGAREFYAGMSKSRAKKLDPRLRKAAEYYFGGWHQATLAAGLNLPPPVRWSRDRVLEEIRSRHRKRLSLRRTVIEGEMSGLLAAANRIFGNWPAAVHAAGLSELLSRSSQRWTRDELIQLLRKLKKEAGFVDRKVLAGITREGYGTPLWSIRRVFGSEGKAKRAAGVE